MKAPGRRSDVLALALALSACACGADLVWYGHGADRTQRAEIRQRGGAQWLRIGDRESARYAAIAVANIVTAPAGSRFAFAAMRRDEAGRERWHVVRDFVESRAWDGVASLTFAPDGQHFAYAGEAAGRWHVVLDAHVGPAFDDLDSSLSFSPDGSRVGYVGYAGHCAYPVAGGRVGACHRSIRRLFVGNDPQHDIVVASDSDEDTSVVAGGRAPVQIARLRDFFPDSSGEHWAAIGAGDDGRPRVIVDGAPESSHDEVGSVVWAPKRAVVSYTARDGTSWFSFVAGARGTSYRSVEPPVFAARSQRYGYIGRGEAQSQIIIDGRVRWTLPTPSAGALTLSDDGERVAFVYRDLHGPVVVVDDRAFRFDMVVDASLQFSRNGRHWAVLAGAPSKRKLFIAIDGSRKLPFDTIELFGGGLVGDDVSAALGRWVAAELEHFVNRRNGA